MIHRQLRTDRYRRITVVNADGSDPHVVTDHAYTEYPFAWSPDSRQILYGRQDRQGIYVIGADGRGNHLVTATRPARPCGVPSPGHRTEARSSTPPTGPAPTIST